MPESFAHVLESLREPGTSRLSVERVAALLELQQQYLATFAGVHLDTVRMHPELARLQAALRDMVRVLSAACAIQSDLRRAVFFIKNEPIAAFDHRTLLEATRIGQVDVVVAYLESIASGFVG